MAENQITQSQNVQESSPGEPPVSSSGSKNKTLLLGALGIVAVVALVAIFSVGGGAEKKAQAAPMTFACATPDCGFTEIRSFKLDETLPAKCPKCGNKTLYCSRKCPNCSTAVIMDEDRGLPGPTKCPKCGSEVRHGE